MGESPKPPEDVADMRAEHAAVHVGLVDDDHAQVVEHVAPAVVVGQDPDVQHVRVREDRVRRPPNVRALADRRVAVVDRGPEGAQAEPASQRA